ncbi:MAG: RNA polymerase factor sigma-54 [Bacteroidetes bacterium]|nr:RNA polymerase factor sigma-54 [Bacteroidota bacterium]
MLKQSLQQKLQQKLSPQQIQLMKLLQVPTAALEQRIKEELEVNPALEEGRDEENDDNDSEYEDPFTSESDAEQEDHADQNRDDFDLSSYIDDDETPAYKLSANNYSPDDERREIPFAGGTTFQEQLIEQLRLRGLNERDFEIAAYLIGNLDEDGYLRREIESVVDDLAFSQNIMTDDKEIVELLKEVQQLDPPGIGARTLQECLLIQLERKEYQTVELRTAAVIIRECMDDFSRKHYERIMKKLELEEDELRDAIKEILKLNPKPGNSQSDNQKNTQHITPDFILSNNEGNLELYLNSRNAPELKISRTYQEMLEHYAKAGKLKDKQDKDAVLFVKQKIDSARWFIDAIRQRQQTLMLTMQAILEYQYEYFQDGDETKLRPMILKDIAEKVGLDISTVSRVANSKYIQTPFGTKLLKSFFSESLSTDSGEEVSTREVKKILEEAVQNENKSQPVTDDQLAQVLREKGYNIARRTVAKYREQLNIPVARLRKEL